MVNLLTISDIRHACLYDVLVLLGVMIAPASIPWTALQVNDNYQTKKHIDKNNIGP